jgi:glutamate-1-semialdehyde aminotransferase
VIAAVRRGNAITAGYRSALAVAEQILESIGASTDTRVAFFGAGTAAVRAAAQACRLRTGRKYIVSAGYHGWDPMWAPREPFCPNDQDVFDFFYAPDVLEQFLDRHTTDVAAVVVSPDYVHLHPSVLPRIYEICRNAGVLTVSDEVVFGFRWAYGPSVHTLRVNADIYIFAKALSNGSPVAAVAGRSDVVGLLEETSAATTYEPIPLEAARATLGKMRRIDVPRMLRENAGLLVDAATQAIAREQLRFAVAGDGRAFHIIVPDEATETLMEALFVAGFHAFEMEYFLPSIQLSGQVLERAIAQMDAMMRGLAASHPELCGRALTTEDRWAFTWKRLDGFHGDPDVSPRDRDRFIRSQLAAGNLYGRA